jgi:enoyl-CoA hydratase/carnithine racemase
MTTDETLITSRDGRVGRILLNRPKALNALDLSMIRAMTAALTAWRDDPHVHAVVVEGAGERAFCAGGDIRALRDGQISGNRASVDAFFQEEYALNLLISTYPKPYISLIDGICMGGGIGISVHAPYRVATEHSMFAMPETAIGFFPDIGATFFLPRLPGQLGVYLGLTGLRITGADAVHAGFGTHFVSRANLPALSSALAEIGAPALARFAEPLPAYTLSDTVAAIDACFGANTVPEIVARLEADGGAWTTPALKALRTVSPIALGFTLEALRRGAELTLPQALDAEFALTKTTMAYPDFAEGVRAMVVDKDRAPKWQPARIEDVDPAVIHGMFGT